MFNKFNFLFKNKNKKIMNLFLFDKFGININDPNIPVEVLLSIYVLLFIAISILSFANLLVYFTILQISDTNLVLNFIKDKKFLIKIVNFYKKMSILTISIEIIFFIIANGYIIKLCFLIVNNYFNLI